MVWRKWAQAPGFWFLGCCSSSEPQIHCHNEGLCECGVDTPTAQDLLKCPLTPPTGLGGVCTLQLSSVLEKMAPERNEEMLEAAILPQGRQALPGPQALGPWPRRPGLMGSQWAVILAHKKCHGPRKVREGPKKCESRVKTLLAKVSTNWCDPSGKQFGNVPQQI